MRRAHARPFSAVMSLGVCGTHALWYEEDYHAHARASDRVSVDGGGTRRTRRRQLRNLERASVPRCIAATRKSRPSAANCERNRPTVAHRSSRAAPLLVGEEEDVDSPGRRSRRVISCDKPAVRSAVCVPPNEANARKPTAPSQNTPTQLDSDKHPAIVTRFQSCLLIISILSADLVYT